MDGGSDYRLRIRPLDGANFRTWRNDIYAVLADRDLDQFIGDIPPRPPTDADELVIFRRQEKKAWSVIYLSLDDERKALVASTHDPAAVWRTLKAQFEPASRAHIGALYREFVSHKFEDGETMGAYFARLEDVSRRMREGMEPDKKLVSLQAITFLPEEYDHLVQDIYRWSDEDFQFDKVKSVLCDDFFRLQVKRTSSTSEHMGYFAKQSAKSDASANVRQYKSQQPIVRDLTNVTCFNCRERGHISSNCPKPHRRKPSVNRQGNYTQAMAGVSKVAAPPTSLSDDSANGDVNVMQFYVSSYVAKGAKRTLIVDTGATHHIFHDIRPFTSYEPAKSAYVKFGIRREKMSGQGQVTVRLPAVDGTAYHSFDLKNVLHVPDLDVNLISAAQLDRIGWTSSLQGGRFDWYDASGRHVFTAVETAGVYEVHSPTSARPAYEHTTSTEVPILDSSPGAFSSSPQSNWHQRFGHVSLRTLRTMQQRNSIADLEGVSSQYDQCDICHQAKAVSHSHCSFSGVRSKNLLDLVHSDLWGPAPVKTKSGARYFVSFVDDYSRKATIYFLKHKYETFNAFKSYRAYVEKQTGRSIKVLRTDGGMEYCASYFQDHLAQEGIRHERTSAYSPSQNGVAERLNRTIMDGVRCYLLQSGLPFSFWAEGVAAITYVRNRTLHSAIDDIPYTRWYGRMPTAKFLRPMGCIAYILQKPLNKGYYGKLEARARSGILVGYAGSTIGYRIWLPDSNQIVETVHVTFDENVFPMVRTKVPPSPSSQGSVVFPGGADVEVHAKRGAGVDTMPEPQLSASVRDEPVVTRQRVVNTRTVIIPDDLHHVPTGWCKRLTPRLDGTRNDMEIVAPEGDVIRSAKGVERYHADRGLAYDQTKFNYSKEIPAHLASLDSAPIQLSPLHDVDEDGEVYGAAYHVVTCPFETFEQALSSEDAPQWREAIDDEFKMMEDRGVWKEVVAPDQAHLLGTKWVFGIKQDTPIAPKRCRARLVALGNRQRKDEFNETYSPVVAYQVIRALLVIFCLCMGWISHSIDIKCAYLYGRLTETIYLRFPKGYVQRTPNTNALLLERSIYGLHQSGLSWYREFDRNLRLNGFLPFRNVNCVYRLDFRAVLLIYVDDVQILANSDQTMVEVKEKLSAMFTLTDLAETRNFLGVAYEIDPGTSVVLHQIPYAMQIIDTYAEPTKCSAIPMDPGSIQSRKAALLDEEEVGKPYRSVIGALLFLAGRTRPDLSISTILASQFGHHPALRHWQIVQGILSYLTEEPNWCLRYSNPNPKEGIVGYVDADWGSDPNDRRSLSGYQIYLCGQLISWRTCKQRCIALSTMESEFIAISEVVKEILWLQRILEELRPFGYHLGEPIIYSDSRAAIDFARQRSESSRTRHIEIRYLFVKDHVERGHCVIKHVPGEQNIADIMTKPLSVGRFREFRNQCLSEI